MKSVTIKYNNHIIFTAFSELKHTAMVDPSLIQAGHSLTLPGHWAKCSGQMPLTLPPLKCTDQHKPVDKCSLLGLRQKEMVSLLKLLLEKNAEMIHFHREHFKPYPKFNWDWHKCVETVTHLSSQLDSRFGTTCFRNGQKDQFGDNHFYLFPWAKESFDLGV